ncbi:glycosyltransferase family 9 protein [uncultured Thalassospira sp.]|jgi:ADP-heptose:LPS heptosyltransferase|uniref:glycosyltransferase family 9 protein n=1 Tax=uncultured Thalassospira sp. TaxID=404382 RepID=UPI0030DBE135|tara:strand:- start:73655 stop:74665 length:1011 start_codon:yes stop_codon:yes gene_type:complete
MTDDKMAPIGAEMAVGGGEPVRQQRILVIKLSALGDMVMATGPFSAIRQAHPDAHITLLTTKLYVDLAKSTGCFDAIAVDSRPKLTRIGDVLALRRFLRSGEFDRVYDLQTSDRTTFYYRLFWPGKVPEWSGIAWGCSHPHKNPERHKMHTIDRHIDQLADVGITNVPLPHVRAPKIDPLHYGIKTPYVLICPGGSAHRPEKRWPAERFGLLAKMLADYRLTPVLIGTDSEAEVLDRISNMCPRAKNLMGRTDFIEIASLAQNAVLAIGNDTGPVHLAAAVGAPTIVLFSEASNPKMCAPRGHSRDAVSIIEQPDLRNLPITRVFNVIRKRLNLED